jgi:hypothetical protein
MNIAQVNDFAIDLHGSIAMLWPQNEAGLDWIRENICDDHIRWGGGEYAAVVIEHRYIGDIVNGIHDDGLTIKDVIDTRVRS